MPAPTDILPLISTVENGIETIFAKIHDGILTKLPKPIVTVADEVGKKIDDLLNPVEQGVGDIAHGIGDDIKNALGKILPGALDVLHSLVGGLLNAVNQIGKDIATTEDVIGSAINAIRPWAPKLAEWLGNLLIGSIGNAVLGSLTELEKQEPMAIDSFLEEIAKAPTLHPFMATAIDSLKRRGGEWQALALPALLVSFFVGMVEGASEPSRTWIRQESYKKFPIRFPDAPSLIEARIKNVINEPKYQELMAAHGFNPQVADTLFKTQQERLLPEEAARLALRGQLSPDLYGKEMIERGYDAMRVAAHLEASRPLLNEQDLRDLFLRGFVDMPTHDKLLAQHGYTQEQIDRRKRLYFLIPGPNDLIHMAIRNVFSPEIVERFKLFGDFPEPFKQAALMQGISEEWALRYWGAHWIVPSNQEGFDMFHRTTLASEDEHHDTFTLSDGARVENVIGRSTLQLLLREKDTAPYYRNKLIEIAYNPLTRIDVRRMHKVGSLTKAGVERAYLDLGYSPANALRLADYVEKLNHKENLDRAAPIIDRLKNRILDLYIAEKLELSDAAFALKDLGFTDAEQDYFLAEAKLIQKTEEASAVEAGIGRLYVASFIDKSEADSRLQKVAVPLAGRTLLFRKWDTEREFKDLSEEHKKARELTKAEILDGYKARLMTADDAATFLRSLRYTDVEIQLEIGLADFQVARQSRSTQIEAIKALYVNGVRDASTTSNALDALTMPATQRDAFLSEWQLQKEQRTEKIPLATVRDMVRVKFLNRGDAEEQLRRHRLSDLDIGILLDFWEGQEPTGGRQRGKVARG